MSNNDEEDKVWMLNKIISHEELVSEYTLIYKSEDCNTIYI